MNMKFDVNVEGHNALIDLDLAETSFTGTIEKSEAGTGSISGDRVGDSLKGNADLTGHRVDFRAVISCGRIDGELTFGIFFDKKFTGTQVA